MFDSQGATTPKQQVIYDALCRRIEAGDYQPGVRLPSDSQLVNEFGVSRPTVAKAVRQLEKDGFVKRRTGSGTFVLEPQGRKPMAGSKRFGLLISGLGKTEIFEPICGEIARAVQESGHSLIWGTGSSVELTKNDFDHKVSTAWDQCQSYVKDRVSGVFFAPVEANENEDLVNQKIMTAFENAQIPVVLLDRDYVPYPDRSNHDLVGIDNRRIGLLVTKHLFDQGCKKVLFVSRPSSVSTVEARIAGYRDAVANSDQVFDRDQVCFGDPDDQPFIESLIKQHQPDGFACVNDEFASRLMHSLSDLGVAIPQQVKVAGIDDVRYAQLLRVPLTTIHQPCAAIGLTAFATMIERIKNPDAPAKEVLVACRLVVRQSTQA